MGRTASFLLLIVAGLLGWLMTQEAGSEAAERAGRSRGARGAAGAALVEGPGAKGSTLDAAAAASGVRSELAAVAPGEEDSSRTVRVRVVSGVRLEPLQVDELWVLRPQTDLERAVCERLLFGRDHLGEELLAFGERVVPAGGGEVAVRASDEPIHFLLPPGGELHGFAEWSPGSGSEVMLRAWPEYELEVVVEDAQGRPAEGVSLRLGPDPQARGWGQRTERSDARGRVRFEALGQVYVGRAARGEPVFLAPVVAGALRDGTRIDTDPWPAEPVEVRLPETASMVVRVTGFRGEAIAQPPDEEFRLGLSVALEGGGRWRAWRRYHVGRAAVQDGIARFEHVLPGRDLRIEARPPGWYGEREVVVEGPARPGASRTVELDLAAGPCVTGVLADRRGAPFGSGWWRFASSEGQRGRRVWTDERGRFRLLLDEDEEGPRSFVIRPDPDGEEEDLEDWLARIAAGEGEEGEAAEDPRDPGLRGRLGLPARLPAGWSDVGVVPVSRPGVLFAGRVVDPEGRPIAGARIEADVAEVEKEDDGRIEIDWDELHGLGNVETGSDGRFAVLGSLPPDRYRLRAEAEGRFARHPVEVAPGDEEIAIVLHRAGAFEAVLRVPEGVHAGELHVRLEPVSETAEQHRQLVRWKEDLALYRADDLWPGRYTAEVRAGWAGGVLTRISGVEILPGEVTRDERFQPLDLRHLFRAIEVDVLGVGGEPLLVGANIRLNGEGAASRWRDPRFLRASRRGPATYRVITQPEHLEQGLVVQAEDHWPAFLGAPQARNEVRLRPAPVAELGFPRRLEAEEGRWVDLRLSLDRGSVEPRFKVFWARAEVLDEVRDADSVRVRYGLPARYLPRWRVRAPGAAGAEAPVLLEQRGAPIELGIEDDGALVPLEIPQEVLDKLEE